MNIPPREQQKHLVDVLKDRYGLNVWPSFNMLRGGDDYFMIRCPFPDHADRTPSFAIYGDGHFCCYGIGCKRAGDTYELMRHMEPKLSQAELIADVRSATPGIIYSHADKKLDALTFAAISEEIRRRGGDRKEELWEELDAIMANGSRKGLALRLLRQLPKEAAVDKINAYEHAWSKGDILDWTTPGDDCVQVVMLDDYDPNDDSTFHAKVLDADGNAINQDTEVTKEKLKTCKPMMVNAPADVLPPETKADDSDPFAALVAGNTTDEDPDTDPLTVDLEEPTSEAPADTPDEAPEEPEPEPTVEEPAASEETPAEELALPEPQVDDKHAAEEIARWIAQQERKQRINGVVEMYGPIAEQLALCKKEDVEGIIRNSSLFEVSSPGWITLTSEAPTSDEPVKSDEELFEDPEVNTLPEPTDAEVIDGPPSIDLNAIVELIEARVTLNIMKALHEVTGEYVARVDDL